MNRERNPTCWAQWERPAWWQWALIGLGLFCLLTPLGPMLAAWLRPKPRKP